MRTQSAMLGYCHLDKNVHGGRPHPAFGFPTRRMISALPLNPQVPRLSCLGRKAGVALVPSPPPEFVAGPGAEVPVRFAGAYTSLEDCHAGHTTRHICSLKRNRENTHAYEAVIAAIPDLDLVRVLTAEKSAKIQSFCTIMGV
jgi:hypothetical protein